MNSVELINLLPENCKGIFSADQVAEVFSNVRIMAEVGFNVPEPVSIYHKASMKRSDAYIVSRGTAKSWMRTPVQFLKAMGQEDYIYLTNGEPLIKKYAGGITSNLYRARIGYTMSVHFCVRNIPSKYTDRVNHSMFEVILFKHKI